MSLDLINPAFLFGAVESLATRTKAKLNELKSSGFGAVNLSLMHIGYRIVLTDHLRIAENEEASGKHLRGVKIEILN